MTDPLLKLAADLDEDAEKLRYYGEAGMAVAVESIARRVRDARALWLDTPLTPAQYAAILGVTTETARARIRREKGVRSGAPTPAVRMGDLVARALPREGERRVVAAAIAGRIGR